jgi:4-hydroxybenzoate polyprenyltransferase
LRWVPYLKVFLIAAVWSYAGLAYVAVPGWERVSPETLGWLGLVRFFWVLAITIPFDMRDVVSDVQAGIVTLPSRLGLRTSWYISLLAAAVSLVGALAWLPSLPGAPGMWLSYAGLFPVLLAWHIRRGEAYYAYLLDGSVAWQALCIFVQAGF